MKRDEYPYHERSFDVVENLITPIGKLTSSSGEFDEDSSDPEDMWYCVPQLLAVPIHKRRQSGRSLSS